MAIPDKDRIGYGPENMNFTQVKMVMPSAYISHRKLSSLRDHPIAHFNHDDYVTST